jgi:UPF0755 protein
MSDRPRSGWERDEQRNARIRELVEARNAPIRRQRAFQPIMLIVWFAVVMVVAALVFWLGFLAFSPRIMSWVEENPGAVENGLVRDFVAWYRPEELADAPASSERDLVSFEIPEGANDTQIGRLLEQAGLVKSQIAFQYAIIQANREGTLASGVYDLSPTMRPSEIVARLVGQSIVTTNVTIREGLRLEEIVAAFEGSGMKMDLAAFAEVLRHPPAELKAEFDFLAELPEGRSLEGYLAPNTYNFDVEYTPTQVAEIMLNAFGDNTLTPEVRAGIESHGLTIDQGVIIASIVEREAVLEEERPLIAGVYINRVTTDAGQAETAGLLNADPTIQYGRATATYVLSDPPIPMTDWGNVNWWEPLPDSGGNIELPESLMSYQTYLVPGLPASPIAAPRSSSVAAIADADTASGNLYFVAACPNGVRDGSHRFATNSAEHQANIDQANAECPAG